MVNSFRSSRHPREILLADWKDAEELAAWYMGEKLGMTGVRLTAPGADRGIDVTADVGVAQVKHQATPVGAPVVQGALGAGHGRQKVLFFALSGFTRQAADFAQQAGVALFSYDIYGSVTPRNAEANSLLTITDVDSHTGSWSRAEQIAEQIQRRGGELKVRAERKRQEAREALDRSSRQLASLVERLERQTDAEEDDEALSFVLQEYSSFLRHDGLLVGDPINAVGISAALDATTAARPGKQDGWDHEQLDPTRLIKQAACDFLVLYDELGNLDRLRTLRLPQWVAALDSWKQQEARISLMIKAVVSGGPADAHSQTELEDLILFGLVAQEGDRIANRWQAQQPLEGDFEALEETVASDPVGRGREWSTHVLAQYRCVEWTNPNDEIDEEILQAEAEGVLWDPTRFIMGSRPESIDALRYRISFD